MTHVMRLIIGLLLWPLINSQNHEQTSKNSKNSINSKNSKNSINSHCPEGWKGSNCQIDINECTENRNLCKHGGICINTVPGFECRCLSVYEGTFCENVRDGVEIGIDFSCPNGK